MAEISAKEIEHTMGDEALGKFVNFLEFMSTCSCKEPKWMKSFKQYSSNNGLFSEKCMKCIATKKENPQLNNSQCCGMA